MAGFQAHPNRTALQVHGRGAGATAALHVPAIRGGPQELPRGAARAPGAQADAAPRPAQVPVRSLSRDPGKPRPLLWAQGCPPHPNFPFQEPSTRTSCLFRPLPFLEFHPSPFRTPSLIPPSKSKLVFPQTPNWPGEVLLIGHLPFLPHPRCQFLQEALLDDFASHSRLLFLKSCFKCAYTCTVWCYSH